MTGEDDVIEDGAVHVDDGEITALQEEPINDSVPTGSTVNLRPEIGRESTSSTDPVRRPHTGFRSARRGDRPWIVSAAMSRYFSSGSGFGPDGFPRFLGPFREEFTYCRDRYSDWNKFRSVVR